MWQFSFSVFLEKPKVLIMSKKLLTIFRNNQQTLIFTALT
jgi:hypothetical protein